MERYIARKRARFKGIGGWPVNIPYGTSVACEDGFLLLDGKRLCASTSRLSHDFFSPDNDGQGKERGRLVAAILDSLQSLNQEKWDRVWADALCRKYKRPEHEDFWLWNHDFYGAPVEALRYIAGLVGAKVRV